MKVFLRNSRNHSDLAWFSLDQCVGGKLPGQGGAQGTTAAHRTLHSACHHRSETQPSPAQTQNEITIPFTFLCFIYSSASFFSSLLLLSVIAKNAFSINFFVFLTQKRLFFFLFLRIERKHLQTTGQSVNNMLRMPTQIHSWQEHRGRRLAH